MRASTVITIGAGAYLLWWLFRRGRALQSFGNQVNVRLINVKFKRLTLFNVEVALIMEIINPSGQSVSIDSIAADVKLDGSNFGKINMIAPFNIPANGTQKIEVPILISNTSIIPNLVNIAQNITRLKADITGSINVRGLGPVPFTQNIGVA